MTKMTQAAVVATTLATAMLAAAPALAHHSRTSSQVVVDAPYSNVEVDRGDVRVEAPYTRVRKGRDVEVDAPYTSVRVNRGDRRIRIRAPYVNLNIGY